MTMRQLGSLLALLVSLLGADGWTAGAEEGDTICRVPEIRKPESFEDPLVGDRSIDHLPEQMREGFARSQRVNLRYRWHDGAPPAELLEDGAALHGILRTADGTTPPVSCKVFATAEDRDGLWRGISDGFGHRGEFRLAIPIEEGTRRVRVFAWIEAGAGYAQAKELELDVTKGHFQQDLEFPVEPSEDVVITLRDEAGERVENAFTHVTLSNGIVEPIQAMDARADVLIGGLSRNLVTFGIHAEKRGLEPFQRSGFVPSSTPVQITLRPSVEQEISVPIRWSLHPELAKQGTLDVRPYSLTAEGKWVELGWGKTFPLADGSGQFPLRKPGRYGFTFNIQPDFMPMGRVVEERELAETAKRTARWCAWGETLVENSTALPVAVNFVEGATIKGKLYSAGEPRVPLGRVSVELTAESTQGTRSGGYSQLGTGFRAGVGSVATEDDGSFEFTGLLPGTFTLEAKDQTLLTKVSAVVQVGTGPMMIEQDLRLVPNAGIEGIVLDPDGAPRAGIEVVVAPYLGPDNNVPAISDRPTAVTNGAGGFSFANLPASRLIVNAANDERVWPPADVTLSPGETTFVTLHGAETYPVIVRLDAKLQQPLPTELRLGTSYGSLFFGGNHPFDPSRENRVYLPAGRWQLAVGNQAARLRIGPAIEVDVVAGMGGETTIHAIQPRIEWQRAKGDNLDALVVLVEFQKTGMGKDGLGPLRDRGSVRGKLVDGPGPILSPGVYRVEARSREGHHALVENVEFSLEDEGVVRLKLEPPSN